MRVVIRFVNDETTTFTNINKEAVDQILQLAMNQEERFIKVETNEPDGMVTLLVNLDNVTTVSVQEDR